MKAGWKQDVHEKTAGPEQLMPQVGWHGKHTCTGDQRISRRRAARKPPLSTPIHDAPYTQHVGSNLGGQVNVEPDRTFALAAAVILVVEQAWWAGPTVEPRPL